jgi:AraC-like DNA-binding protein
MRYPVAFVQLARVLSSAFDLRDVAAALGLGLSTLYRWVPKESKGHIARRVRRINDFAFIEDIARLVAACEAGGLSIRESVLRLAPEALSRHGVFARSPAAAALDDRAQTAIQLASDNAYICVATDVVPSDDMSLVKSEIEEHYQRALSCDDLARVAGMPKFSFIRKFTSTFSVSPYRYLINVRVQHAKRLLPLTDQSLESIAVAVGFGSTSSMQRAFRRFTGASPGNFMALAGQSAGVAGVVQPSAKFLATPMIAA